MPASTAAPHHVLAFCGRRAPAIAGAGSSVARSRPGPAAPRSSARWRRQVAWTVAGARGITLGHHCASPKREVSSCRGHGHDAPAFPLLPTLRFTARCASHICMPHIRRLHVAADKVLAVAKIQISGRQCGGDKDATGRLATPVVGTLAAVAGGPGMSRHHRLL
ncbi:unnamed protein product [Urochloa humidicola]